MELYNDRTDVITVGTFMQDIFSAIENRMTSTKPFSSKEELREWLELNRPKYERYFEETVSYFGRLYKLI